MTANKRRKADARSAMAATGTNYTRALRTMTAEELKDRVNLSWSPGLDESGELRITPRNLLITGISATEPERLLRSMIDQLDKQNSAKDLEFWIINPGYALKSLNGKEKVKRFVEDAGDHSDLAKGAAKVMMEAQRELERRLKIMNSHPKRPHNIYEARLIAIEESNEAGIAPEYHKMYFRHIVVVGVDFNAFSNTNRMHASRDQKNVAQTAYELILNRPAGIHLAISMLYADVQAMGSGMLKMIDKIVMNSSVMSSQIITGHPDTASTLDVKKREAIFMHSMVSKQKFTVHEYRVEAPWPISIRMEMKRSGNPQAEAAPHEVKVVPNKITSPLTWRDRLEDVANNAEKWGGDNGIKNPEPECVESARSLLQYIEDWGIETPAIFANEDGGITIEWGSPERVITVEVAKYGIFDLFTLDTSTKEAQDFESTGIEQVREFISKHAPKKREPQI